MPHATIFPALQLIGGSQIPSQPHRQVTTPGAPSYIITRFPKLQMYKYGGTLHCALVPMLKGSLMCTPENPCLYIAFDNAYPQEQFIPTIIGYRPVYNTGGLPRNVRTHYHLLSGNLSYY